ncbi:MAG: hypothetical protein KDA89_05300, partial [Planctomycetaceae bacterium]|nr:hypothetical protein [Planctomycetaceae bacterium]
RHKAGGERRMLRGIGSAVSGLAHQSGFHRHKAGGEQRGAEKSCGEQPGAEQFHLSAFAIFASGIFAFAAPAAAIDAFASTGFTPVERRPASYNLSPNLNPGHHRPRAGGAMTGQLQAERRTMSRQRHADEALTGQRHVH